jgi:uncharacterized membrane protein YsdA (DUF1294 family)
MTRSHHMGRRRGPLPKFALLALALALALGIVLAWLTSWPWYVVWAGAASLTNFLFYGLDKAQARRAGLRVPERVLHGLALAGGALGGGAGMFVWRHKTRTPGFKTMIVLGLVLQVAVVLLMRGMLA